MKVTDEMIAAFEDAAWEKPIKFGGIEMGDNSAGIAAVLAIIERDHLIKEVVHLVRPNQGTTACCGRTPFELSRNDRFTADLQATSCPLRVAVAEQETPATAPNPSGVAE